MEHPHQSLSDLSDSKALEILAKSIYRELRASGLCEREVMTLAGELLDLVTSDVAQGPPAR